MYHAIKEEEKENITEMERGVLLMIEVVAKSELNRSETLALYGITQYAKYIEKVNLFNDHFTVNKDIAELLDIEMDVIEQTLIKLIQSNSIIQLEDDKYSFFPF